MATRKTAATAAKGAPKLPPPPPMPKGKGKGPHVAIVIVAGPPKGGRTTR